MGIHVDFFRAIIQSRLMCIWVLKRSAAQVCGCECDESIHGIRAFGDDVTLSKFLDIEIPYGFSAPPVFASIVQVESSAISEQDLLA